MPATFPAFRIHSDDAGYRSGIEPVSLDDLAPGEVVVKAAWSSVNYKDALAGTGKGKILRRFPLVGGIDGRNTDLLITRDGRRVAWLNPVFYGLPVRQSQIVQETLDRIRVRVAPAPEFGARTEQTITDRLRSRMGEVAIHIERVDEIPRTSNGKLQAVVCCLTPEEREAALRGVTAASVGLTMPERVTP